MRGFTASFRRKCIIVMTARGNAFAFISHSRCLFLATIEEHCGSLVER